MDHLYNSLVRVERLVLTVSAGVATMDYAQATDPDDPIADEMLHALKCRLDLNFLREGKDIPAAPEAGKATDRIGVLFSYPYAPLKAGDRLVTIPNAYGKTPVSGTFEIRSIPDEAIDFSDRHHIEVQIIEVGQELTPSNWPTEEATED